MAGGGDSERLNERERFFPARVAERAASGVTEDLVDFPKLLVVFENLVFAKMLEETGRAEGSADLRLAVISPTDLAGAVFRGEGLPGGGVFFDELALE